MKLEDIFENPTGEIELNNRMFRPPGERERMHQQTVNRLRRRKKFQSEREPVDKSMNKRLFSR